MRKSLALLLVILTCMTTACHKDNNTNTAIQSDSNNPAYNLVKGSLTVPPFDTADVTGLVPLGNLNPPAHTFPTDHMYFYCFTSAASLNIKSPGNIHIVRIERIHYNAGTSTDHYDYTITLGADSSNMYWGHVSELSPRLQAVVNNFTTAYCTTPYATGGSTYETCYLTVSLSATPGEILGIAKATNGLAGMDFGVSIKNTGANPLDYFDAASRSMMEAKLGSFDGKVKRTALPLCGEIDLDVPGTAQGNWIKQGFAKNPEDNNIALVKYNIDPSRYVFSIGTGVPTLTSNVYFFDTQNSGSVNRKFSDVTADGNTYCYTLSIPGGNTGYEAVQNTSILIRLDNATTLSAEKRNCDCSCMPYTFTSNKISYTR